MNYEKEILRLTRAFSGTKYESLLQETILAYISNDVAMTESLMSKFPSDKQLLENIIEKVKNKSVYANMKKALESNGGNNADTLIGVSSLMTHVAIECKENREYRALLPDLHKKLGELIRTI